MGGHPGKVWLALSLDNTKLEKQSSAALPNRIHVRTNEKTSSARFSIKIPKKELPVLEAHVRYDQTDWLLFARTVPWQNGCRAAKCEVLCESKMVECGHGVKAQHIHTGTTWLQQACRWCSSINPVPLFLLFLSANHDENVNVAHF